MKKIMAIGAAVLFITYILFTAVSCGNINTVGDSHFDEEGYLQTDSVDTAFFAPQQPSQVKFYVEVSGSMNDSTTKSSILN